MDRLLGLDISHETRAIAVFRPNWLILTRPAFAVLLTGVLLNWIFLPWSTVAAGDSGPVLFGRVLASMILLVAPALLLSFCVMLLTMLAGMVWNHEQPDVRRALTILAQDANECIPLFGVLVGIYMLFAAVFAFAAVLALILLVPTAMLAEFIIPAILLGRIRARQAFILGRRFLQIRPLHLARGLLFPAVLAAIVMPLGEGFRRNLWLGDAIFAAAGAVALSFSVLVLVGWYRDSYDDPNAGAAPQIF